jgi:hypothetical protein
MGLLEKRNPKANARSVLKQVALSVAVGVLVFFFFFKPSYQDAWPVTLPVWVALCAFVSALWEWQVGDAE